MKLVFFVLGLVFGAGGGIIAGVVISSSPGSAIAQRREAQVREELSALQASYSKKMDAVIEERQALAAERAAIKAANEAQPEPKPAEAQPVQTPPLAQATQKTTAEAQPAARRVPQWDKSASIQKERKGLLNDLLRNRVFTKIEDNSSRGIVRVTVGPRFYDIDFDDKTNFMSVVFAYYFEEAGLNLVRIYDSRTGKSVGRFSQYGLRLD